MEFDLIIKNGTLVTATENIEADLGIKGEKIAAIAPQLPTSSPARIINAEGKYVLPGAIDVHVHFQLPFCGTVSADDFLSGTRAAAHGGVTTIIDFATQDPEKGLQAGIEKRMQEAEEKVCVDYSLHCSITRWSEKTAAELPHVVEFGVPSFKMFMIYESEGWQSDDAAIYSALLKGAECGALLGVHAESERVMNLLIKKYLAQKDLPGAYGHPLSRPNFIEEEAVQRAIKWAEVTGGRLYIVHLSTTEAAEQVKTAQERGVRVHAETCPQYLLLDDELFKDPETGHLYATCPPLRKPKDSARLWQGLQEGELSIVSTDTCTFTTEQKAMWGGDFTKIPYGMPGVETLFPSLYTFGVMEGKFSLNHLVGLVSTNPARLMGLYPRKGTLAVGSDADVIIVDPQKKVRIDYEELETNCDWSPYQGMEMAGFPEVTLCRGAVIVENGKFVGKKGYGRFLPRTPGGEL